jgi:hypothetical protein
MLLNKCSNNCSFKMRRMIRAERAWTALAAPQATMAAVLVLLLVLQHGSQPANSQGLSISNEAVGAGESATAAQFAVFEEALLLASQTTGGR